METHLYCTRGKMRLFKDGKAQKNRAFDFSKSLILVRAQYINPCYIL